MSSLVVNLDMRFIDNNIKCYILFPGRGYYNYSNILEQEAIYLDFPGLPLNEGNLKNRIYDWEARVTVSDRIKKWFSQGQDPSTLPPRSVSELGSYRSSKRKRLFSGLLNGFFFNINKGDLVVVPSPDQEGLVLFGEVIDEPRSVVRLKHPFYEGETVPGRRVRWVKQVPRNAVPRWLDSKLPSPNPLRQIEKNFYSQIFDIAYERYHYEDNYVCKFTVNSIYFDALSNIEIQQFLIFPAALYEASENDPNDGIYKLIRKNLDRSKSPEQRISISSPGYIVVVSRTAASIIAGIFLLSCSDVTVVEAKPKTIAVVNDNLSLQSEKQKRCLIDMEDEIKDDMELMNHKQWQEACELGLITRHENGLDTGIKKK